MVTILIAEDEPDIRELVKLTLQFAGFEVIATTNGAELVERAPEVMPDLILSDVRMPRMTGYEACRALKNMPEVAGIPVAGNEIGFVVQHQASCPARSIRLAMQEQEGRAVTQGNEDNENQEKSKNPEADERAIPSVG